MSTKTVVTTICDRCGCEDVAGINRGPWGSVVFRIGQREFNTSSGDVCSDCIKDLMKWWRAPKNIAAGRA